MISQSSFQLSASRVCDCQQTSDPSGHVGQLLKHSHILLKLFFSLPPPSSDFSFLILSPLKELSSKAKKRFKI